MAGNKRKPETLTAKLTGMKDKFGQVAALVNPGC